MFLMRIALFLHFNSQGNTLTDTAEAFFLGLRFDLRAVSLILLIILVFGSIPFLHPFRNRKTAVGWLILLAIITFTIAFFYVADFSHYSYLTQRLNASVLNYLDDAAISMNMVWQSYPVVWLTLGLVIATGLIFWFFKESHRRINKRFAPVTKNTRVISFVVLFLILGVEIFLFKQLQTRDVVSQHPAYISPARTTAKEIEFFMRCKIIDNRMLIYG